MCALPAGTVTFLLTDIEDSSSFWERRAAPMQIALGVHDKLIADAVSEHGGHVVKHMGDGCWAAFDSAPNAAAAAIGFQQMMQREAQDLEVPIKVRIGLHTGDVKPTEEDYFGPVPNRSARVTSLANGDQIICSSSTAGLLRDLELRSEGLHDLRGIGPEEIFMVCADEFETDPRPIRRPVPPTNLPRIHTSFLGRRDEVAQTLRFLEDEYCVVTLLGPGGVGKTRLAVEVGAEFAKDFAGTVHFCDLAAVGESESVVAAVAEVVGARQQPGMDLVGSIADYLVALEVLLILDNCEHVMDVVCSLAERLAAVDGVHVLATSREALGLPVEQLVTISPLSVDAAGVDLFVDRAQNRDAGFALTPANEVHVRDIVQRLDGIPLAIELAAARIRLMTPAEIAERLDDRFRLLGGRRGRERHETLRATVSWSFKLLAPAEVALFTRLCVFSGGFSLDAAEAVCADDELIDAADVPDLVMALVDKSMVVSRAKQGRQRFSMLETLRRFGEEELADGGTSATFRRRHADYYRELALKQHERMFSTAEADAWMVLDTEWPNLRTALDTFEIEKEIGPGADLVVALTWFATVSMRNELFTWASELLSLDGIESHASYTDLCGAAALGAYLTVQGDVSALAEAGLAADPSDTHGFCHIALAAVMLNNLHTAEASDELTADWLTSPPTTLSSQLWAHAFRTFHLCTHAPGPEAAIHAAAAAKLAEQTGSPTAKGIAAWAEGQVVFLDDRERAMQVWTDGLEWPRSLNQGHLVEHVVVGILLHFAARRGELLETLESCRNALRAALDQHYFVGTSHLFGVVAIALTRAGDAETGAQLLGAMVGNGHQPRRNAVRTLEAALGDQLDSLMGRGSRLGITEASHIAIAALAGAIEHVKEQPE